MNSESRSLLSNNNTRRMQAWARSAHPADWQDRCAIVTEYLAQLSDAEAASLLKKTWPEIFAETEKAWPEAFAGLPEQPVEWA